MIVEIFLKNSMGIELVLVSDKENESLLNVYIRDGSEKEEMSCEEINIDELKHALRKLTTK